MHRDGLINKLLAEKGVKEISVGKYQQYDLVAKYGAGKIPANVRVILIEDTPKENT